MNYLEEWQDDNLGWLKKKTVKLDCLSEKQAAKWFLLHERQRHAEDIIEIDKDLKKLEDIKLPAKFIEIIGCRFEV